MALQASQETINVYFRSMHYSFLGGQTAIEILKEEIKVVIMGKNVCENGGKLYLIEVLGIFGLAKIRGKKKAMVHLWSNLPQVTESRFRLSLNKSNCSFGEKWLIFELLN